MKETVKISDFEKRGYPYGPGIKISFKTESEKYYHAVFFSNSPLYNLIQDFRLENVCKIKGEVIESGEDHSLLRIFNIGRIAYM